MSRFVKSLFWSHPASSASSSAMDSSLVSLDDAWMEAALLPRWWSRKESEGPPSSEEESLSTSLVKKKPNFQNLAVSKRREIERCATGQRCARNYEFDARECSSRGVLPKCLEQP